MPLFACISQRHPNDTSIPAARKGAAVASPPASDVPVRASARNSPAATVQVLVAVAPIRVPSVISSGKQLRP